MRIAVPDRPAPARRLTTPRLVALFGLFVLSAALFCAIAGVTMVRQADERQALEHRAVLLSAIADVRNAGVNFAAIEPRHLSYIERVAGLKDLRFEVEPEAGPRELQSVVDGHGRIIGWFSWLPDRSLSNAVSGLGPLLALTGLCLIGFAGVALWQVQRAFGGLTRSEQLAWTLAHEDMLTGLPNHRKLVEMIDAALAARSHGEAVTLAFIDIDGLQNVNDALGQRFGDELLIALASRLGDILPPGAQCGRIDGDQFAVLTTARDADDARSAVAALIGSLGRPFWVNDQVVQVGATAGLAQVPRDALTRDELVRRADLALRAGKRKRRGSLVHFEPAMDVEFDERRFLEREIKKALTEQAFSVHYQPIVDAAGNRIVGAEALLRWDHPARGPIPPADFVPVAEACGLMASLGEFVLRRALSDAKRWPDLFISINLSPEQVRDPAMVNLVAEVVAQNQIPASRVVLEVTEGLLIDNAEEAKLRLDALHALGVRLALDDFGTGYSSLSYLQRFRFDKLKIDRSFVAPLGRNPNSQALMQAIVALGRALGLGLLAEGVETEEQRVLLRLAGCGEMQGFLFARPAPREALDRLLAEARPPARAAVA
jgi:diguanylate cyclase (GGDEF)-like protein